MSANDTPAERLIRQFELAPHPEGGYYRETYRSPMGVTVKAGKRAASTAIYYMLEPGAHSAWHRIASDEIWHFYAGAALNVYVLDERGLITHRLGDPLREPGCAFQVVVPAGLWFAAELASDALGACEASFTQSSTGAAQGRSALSDADNPASDAFALVGCTVAPGFEFSEFELADVPALLKQYSAHTNLIARLAPAQR